MSQETMYMPSKGPHSDRKKAIATALKRRPVQGAMAMAMATVKGTMAS